MSGKWTNAGIRKEQDLFFAFENMLLDIFTNNYTPLVGSVIANFTLGAWDTYAQVTLDKTLWNAATTDGSDVSHKTYPVQYFDAPSTGGDVTVYGYVVHDAAGVVLFAERFVGAPLTIYEGGADFAIAIDNDVENLY